MHSGVAARCSRLELRGEHEEEAKASLGGREGARACWGPPTPFVFRVSVPCPQLIVLSALCRP